MKTVKSLFVSIFIISCSFIAFSPTAVAQEKQTYEVRQGETLYSISKKLGVSITELRQWNNISNNEIQIGQQLVYYKRETEADNPQQLTAEQPSQPLIHRETPPENTFYIVKSGDNLYSIARGHNMTLNQLKELNNLSGDLISVGQQLVVRAPASAPPSVSSFTDASTPQGRFSLYKVQQGENLNSVLQKFRMEEGEFRELNPRVNIQNLIAGQEITVLLPPSREFENPYLQKANLEDLGNVAAIVYDATEAGRTTTNGELYNPEALTGAHSNIELGRVIFVENPATGKGVYVRINDRITGQGIKLSQRVYQSLGFKQNENAFVTIYLES